MASKGKPTLSRTHDGGTRQTFKDGTQLEKGRDGRPTHFKDPSSGVEAHKFDRSGRPMQISRVSRDGRTTIQRGVGNERRIETTRTVPGGVEHVVNYGNHRGYVERPIVGRPGYVQRTVVVGDRSYGVVYHSYYYHNVMIYSPVPAVVFAPAYYGWLVTPWPRPIYYTPEYWGWAGQPWYGYYGANFTPYPAYASPDQWLTDYIIAANLQQAYTDQQGEEAIARPVITDEMKGLMAEDVKNELVRQQHSAGDYTSNNNLSAQNAEAVPEAMQDHLFTVHAAPIEVQRATGGTCSLATGDMLFRTADQMNSDATVDVEVKLSHADANHSDLCEPRAHAKVHLSDLQEMYNHKKELLAEGEQKQAQLVGKKHGMPKGPKADPKPVEVAKVDPDTQAAVEELKKQLRDADDTEKQVASATSGS
jgi:hypothetical protein